MFQNKSVLLLNNAVLLQNKGVLFHRKSVLGAETRAGLIVKHFTKFLLTENLLFAIIPITHDLACLPAANRILSGNLQTV
jgi:hypothetical protein